jgi:hypothetical protein
VRASFEIRKPAFVNLGEDVFAILHRGSMLLFHGGKEHFDTLGHSLVPRGQTVQSLVDVVGCNMSSL